MANGTGTTNAANVTTGTRRFDGGIYIAPLGTAVPTDASTDLGAAFKNLGYVSEDGVTNSLSVTSKDIKEWGGDTVTTVKTGQNDTFKLKYIESMNLDVLKSIYGADNVTEADGAVTVKVNAKNAGAEVYVIDMAQNGGRLKRIVIPRGTVSALGDIVYKNDTPVGYDVTISAGLDTNGNTHYEYISAAAANNA